MRKTTRPNAEGLLRLARRSVEVIRTNQDPSGAYVACPAFPVYRYSWLRDGAFIADAMSRAGDIANAEAFFGWCSRVIEGRASRIEALIARAKRGEAIDIEAFLPARYRLDGSESNDDWTDFQLDGYGTWLWALGAHSQRHGRSVAPYRAGALESARYVAAFWEHPSYDWWEEHADRRHTSTLAAIYGGLRAAARWTDLEATERAEFSTVADLIQGTVVKDASKLGRLRKWLGGSGLDASLIAVATPFRLLEPDDPLVQATIEAIEADLVHAGGVHRYDGDTFYGGGEWLLLAAFLGWHYAEIGRFQDAWRELDWIASRANDRDELPEQVPDHLLAPDEFPVWQARWGPIAQPLLWSHAMFLSLALELGAVDRAELAANALPLNGTVSANIE